MIRPRSALRDKQHIIRDYMTDEPAKLIVAKMGSGKTGAALTAARDLLDSFAVRHILIIAPKLVARVTWPDEIEAWEHTRCISYAVAVGTDAERAAAVARRCEITTINFENLQWLAKHIGSVKNWYWDMVIIDESSRLKSGKKRTTRAKVKDRKTGKVKIRKGGNMTRFGVLATARQKISRIYGLTGTPTPQGVRDLWGQIYVLDQGERLGRTITSFEERWFNKDPYTYQVTEKEGAEAEIVGKVGDIMVTIPADKLCDDPIFIPVKVTLPPKVLKDYLEFEKSLYSEAYDVEAVSRGVLANKLLQFANGSMYQEDGKVVKIHDAKIEALDEIITQAGDDNILVFYSFKFDLDAIKAKYPHAVVANEDPDFIHKWNDGEIKLLLAHPASIGHGTNLQFGGHIEVWFGLTWNLEYYQQGCARLPRPGQKSQVLIYQILAAGTYDENALEALGGKDATQERITSSLIHRIVDS